MDPGKDVETFPKDPFKACIISSGRRKVVGEGMGLGRGR